MRWRGWRGSVRRYSPSNSDTGNCESTRHRHICVEVVYAVAQSAFQFNELYLFIRRVFLGVTEGIFKWWEHPLTEDKSSNRMTASH